MTLSKTIRVRSPLPPGETYGMPDCRIDVHKRVLAVAVANVEVEGNGNSSAMEIDRLAPAPAPAGPSSSSPSYSRVVAMCRGVRPGCGQIDPAALHGTPFRRRRLLSSSRALTPDEAPRSDRRWLRALQAGNMRPSSRCRARRRQPRTTADRQVRRRTTGSVAAGWTRDSPAHR